MLMMDRGHSPSATVCTLCGEAFQLPEDDIPGNLPRILLCGHIFCTFCLLSVQCDDVIRCPNCEVESALPEGGVYGLQEDSRIVGLIYTAKINKMKRSRYQKRKRLFITGDINTNIKNTEQPADIKKIEKAVDEALVQAAENLAKLEHINETLMAGVVEEVKREQTHLKMEIKQATDEALHAVQKWADVQLHGLTKPEAQISSRQAVVTHVQERIKALVIAMQIAREVRRVPFLEQYCILDKVLETLQAPVDETSFDMKCVTKGPEMSYYILSAPVRSLTSVDLLLGVPRTKRKHRGDRAFIFDGTKLWNDLPLVRLASTLLAASLVCVFQSESLSQSLVLSLKMEVRSPKHNQPNNSNTKSLKKKEKKRNDSLIPDRNSTLSTPDKQKQENPEGNEPSSQGSTPSPRPHKKRNSSGHSPSSDLKSPDVIIEELFEETRPESAAPPTGPELASNKWKVHRRRENHLTGNKRKVTQWVVVTHVVNPSHFYVRYVAEIRESEILSKKISDLCCKDGCLFKLEDTVESGSLIFAKCKEGVWSRSRVVKVFQNGSVEAVKGCIVTQLASVQVFFPDYGFTKSIFIQSKERTTESSLKAVNSHLRKVGEFVKVDLDQFAPQAIRCALKDLVPFDLTKGWSREAQVQLCSIVGSSAVEMWPLGQDRDSLLVDLRKTPMEQSTDVPISVREYLVFIEVARFYSPVTLDRKPLMYYPPVYPQINKELNAVVCHINNPADFYIQLVDNMESLLLSAKLQDCYNATHMYGEEELRVYCPVIGQVCAARFEDKLWYRAQVIGHPGQRKVEVQYVDYGNKKILSVSDLRKIKDEFLALPAKAIPCSLADVIPVDGKTWSEACTNRFISLAHQQCVTIVATETVSKNKSLPIKVFESGLNGPEANIAELLVKEELACFKEGLELKNKHSVDDSAIWDPPLELTSLAEEVDTPEQIISGEEDPLQPQMKLPVQLKDLRVRVSFINSPSSFYIQFTHNNSQLKRICELVKQECTQAEAQDVVWKADMYCAAHINGVWERGQICSDVTSDNIAEVRRCDHGNKVMVHVSSLRLLPSSLMGSFALECTISDIRPAGGRSTWTDTACDVFCYYLTGASALMTIKELTDERPVPVTLFCSNKMGRFISIADFLVNEGLALRERKTRPTVVQEPKETDAQTPASESPTSEEKETFTHPDISSGSPSSSIISVPFRPKPTARTIMSPEKVATSLYLPPELPCLGHVQMTVSAVGDDGLIYVRTQNADYQLQQLRKKIQQSIKTLPRQKPYTWRSVQGCAVFGPDMLWYRGQLLELLGGHVKVQYVDYGLVENIPVVHVYPILLCGDVPQLCMSCQLLSINPVGGKWQRDAVALMREALLSRSVDLQVVELPANPREPLTVKLFLDGLSFSKVLCHLEHASMNWTLSTQKEVTVLPAASLLDDWDFNTEGLMEQEELMLEPFINPNLPKEGKDFQVMVKHLWTPNELFLWPLEETDVEIDKETLDEALTRINANIKTLPRLTSFPCDGPCMAEYSDGKYYRAKLLKITSVEPVMILVQHVDFGSDDTLPTSKLRQIPAELLQFPLQGLKVKVAGFKAPSVNREEDVLPYSPGWSVKAALDMIELLHGNIKATVVAREPELSVLLYNKDKELVHLPLVNNGLAELE